MAELKDLEAGQGASQPPQGPTLSLWHMSAGGRSPGRLHGRAEGP